jgi:hypothetical protein
MRDESFWDRLWFWITAPFYMLIWIYLCLTIKDHPYLDEMYLMGREGEEEEEVI